MDFKKRGVIIMNHDNLRGKDFEEAHEILENRLREIEKRRLTELSELKLEDKKAWGKILTLIISANGISQEEAEELSLRILSDLDRENARRGFRSSLKICGLSEESAEFITNEAFPKGYFS